MGSLAIHRSPEHTRQGIALILGSTALIVYFVPIWLLVKSAWLALGVSIFALSPLFERCPQLEDWIKLRLRLLRDVPTNTQITYAVLQRHPTLCDRIGTVRSLPKLTAPGEPQPPLGKRQRLASLIKQGLDLTERGSEYLSGQRDFNLAEKVLQMTGLPPYTEPLRVTSGSSDEPATFVGRGTAVAATTELNVLVWSV